MASKEARHRVVLLGDELCWFDYSCHLCRLFVVCDYIESKQLLVPKR